MEKCTSIWLILKSHNQIAHSFTYTGKVCAVNPQRLHLHEGGATSAIVRSSSTIPTVALFLHERQKKQASIYTSYIHILQRIKSTLINC